MATDLVEVRVFQDAEKLADFVWRVVKPWDRFARNTTGEQLVRAADSVGANVAESFGQFHYGEKIQFLYYARGSLYERRYWLRRAYRRELLNEQRIGDATQHLERLPVAINNFVRSFKTQRANNKLRETEIEYKVSEFNKSISQSPNLFEELFTEEETKWLTNLT